MKHLWSVVCQHTLANEATHNVSLIEVLEEVKFTTDEEIEKEDSIFIPIYVVTTWIRSDLEKPEKKAEALLRIRAPNGEFIEKVKVNPYKVNLENHTRFRATAYIQGFPFQGNGFYWFVVQQRVSKGWKEVAAVPLRVTKTQPEKAE